MGATQTWQRETVNLKKSCGQGKEDVAVVWVDRWQRPDGNEDSSGDVTEERGTKDKPETILLFSSHEFSNLGEREAAKIKFSLPRI